MKRLCLLLFPILMLTSCEGLILPDKPDDSPTAVFEYLWKALDEQYSFFDVKDVNWKDVHDAYAPLVNDSMSKQALFDVLDGMVGELNDAHANVISDFDVSHPDSLLALMYRASCYDANTVVLHYLGTGYHTTGGFSHNALCGGRVAYWRYASFMNEFSDKDFRHLLDLYADAEGLILDVRQNGGGSVMYLWELLRHFPSPEGALYYTQIKNGPAHDAFTDTVAVYAPECDSTLLWTRPVVVLIDRGSYSATSFFALCCKSYDTITLMGDSTGGGLGQPNGGELPNGWTYRCSITRAIAPDGSNWEPGVPPDLRILLDPDSLAAGRDNIIDAACQHLLSYEQELRREQE
jgi:hypothetical protein